MKAEWARQEEVAKAEERQRQLRMQQLQLECEEFNRCPPTHVTKILSCFSCVLTTGADGTGGGLNGRPQYCLLCMGC